MSRPRKSDMTEDDWAYYGPQYCNAAVGNDCLNPAGWRGGGGYASNSEGPKVYARCKQCDEPCCSKCREGTRGNWLCLNCKATNEEREQKRVADLHYAIREPLLALMA